MLSSDINEKYKSVFDVKNAIKVEGIEYTTKPREGETEGMPKREATVAHRLENLAYLNI
jgi:hypothetical protein